MAHQHNYAIQCHSRWFTWKIQDRRQIENTESTQTKHNPETAKHPGVVTFCDIRPVNEVGSLYSAPEFQAQTGRTGTPSHAFIFAQ